MELPDNLKYLESHEWVRSEADGTYVVGITDFAQDQLGDVVFVELPSAGTKVTAGEAVAVVESVKTASDIYAPFDGEITEVNDELDMSPDLLNSAPFAEGWMFRIRPDSKVNEADLLDADQYRQVTEEQD